MARSGATENASGSKTRASRKSYPHLVWLQSCVAPCPGCPELQCCPGGSCRMGVCTTSCQNEPSGSCVYAPCCPGMRCSTNNNSNYCEVCQNTPGGSCAMAPCCAGSTCSSSKYCVEGGR